MNTEYAILVNSLINKQERECFELLSHPNFDRLTLICIAEYSKIQILIEKENSFDKEKMILSSSKDSIIIEYSIRNGDSEYLLNEVSH